jgi:hypothetical protein
MRWLATPDFGIGLEADALVSGFGFRMIPGVGVEPHAIRPMSPYRPEGPIQQIGPETTALDLGNEAKMLQLHIPFAHACEFAQPDCFSTVPQNVERCGTAAQKRQKPFPCHPETLVPLQGYPYGLIEAEIVVRIRTLLRDAGGRKRRRQCTALRGRKLFHICDEKTDHGCGDSTTADR